MLRRLRNLLWRLRVGLFLDDRRIIVLPPGVEPPSSAFLTLHNICSRCLGPLGTFKRTDLEGRVIYGGIGCRRCSPPVDQRQGDWSYEPFPEDAEHQQVVRTTRGWRVL